MNNDVTIEVTIAEIAAGIIVAQGCRVEVSAGKLGQEIRRIVAKAAEMDTSSGHTELKGQVRNMLRHGSYKPTGRGKPASEYLLNNALKGDFPSINNLVDINNMVSLEYLLPISLIDLDRAAAQHFVIRRGRRDEHYVFNSSGQELDLEDLLLLARLPGDLPCASPIKDSQETKTGPTTRRVLAVIYAPRNLADAAARATRTMAGLLERHCGAVTNAWVEPGA